MLAISAHLRDLVARGRRVVAFTGAGMSAESGIATFRGLGGFWENESLQDLATPEGFERDPAKVWTWYDARRRQISGCAPNAGHLALARYGPAHPRIGSSSSAPGSGKAYSVNLGSAGGWRSGVADRAAGDSSCAGGRVAGLAKARKVAGGHTPTFAGRAGGGIRRGLNPVPRVAAYQSDGAGSGDSGSGRAGAMSGARDLAASCGAASYADLLDHFVVVFMG